jgi:hypothetical protein
MSGWPVVLLLQFRCKPYTAASQNLLYKNRKNRCAVFFRTVFRHSPLAYLFLMPKNRPVTCRTTAMSCKKRPTITDTQKIAGVSEKMGVGPAGMGDPHFFG